MDRTPNDDFYKRKSFEIPEEIIDYIEKRVKQINENFWEKATDEDRISLPTPTFTFTWL